MSDFTDNYLYPSAERIWLCIRFAKWACDRLTEHAYLGILYALQVHIGSAIQRFFSTSAYFVNANT